MDTIEKSFNDLYVGKEFIYKSKYGRTKGIVKSIKVNQSFIFDEDTQNSLAYVVDHSVKGTKTMEKPVLKGEERYMAFQPQIIIESTNGILYELKDCYFKLEKDLEDENKLLYLEKKQNEVF
jgi:hypothetical protein